ncbi:MAG TPA: hypothetical protein VII93_00360 [Anaerolineales bacterium]
MRKRMVIFLSILVMLVMACSLVTSTGNTPQAPGSTAQAPGNTPQGNGNQPGGTPPANPVSINDGLGSLNSYQMTVIIKSIGPDPAQSSTTTVETQHSKDTDASYTHLNMSVIAKGGGDPNNTDSSIYRIGNDQCSGSGEDWTWTTMAPDQAEMLDIIKNMLGLTPLIDTPTFVAQETVNGVPSNHFTFKVSGLGVTSGAEVITNQGDYWLAVDGQYIVKYILVLETSMDPQTNLLHEEISIDLNQINQPINIAFPQACLDASLVTPTP